MYEGEWERGKFHGQGKMQWATGESYEGMWVKDRPHGQGTLTTHLCTYAGGTFPPLINELIYLLIN
jgi:hypothetical protein